MATPENGQVAERRSRSNGSSRQVEAVKARFAAEMTPMERLAGSLITVVAGTPFLILHVVWFGVWIAWNLGALGMKPFDPFPFGLLTMVVSLEAIFLSIFVLMTQNRESRIGELREEMTLEVDMRMEEEVTKTLELVTGLYGRLGFTLGEDEDLRGMLQPLDKRQIEQELESQIGKPGRPSK